MSLAKRAIAFTTLLGVGLGTCAAVQANSAISANIALRPSLSGTYYVSSQLTNSLNINLLVDTGSSYTILDQKTLKHLSALGVANYKNDITGVMADGSEKVAQVYVLKELLIGGCRINNIEVVAFTPEATFVLGINALRQLSPFSIDVAKNALTVNCNMAY